ncbi:MAG: redoxin domain-containing protein [Acidobacteriota bacterium]
MPTAHGRSAILNCNMSSQKSPVKIGDPAPDFRLQSLDGTPLCLSDYRGKRVLLFLWASWCGCREQLVAWQSFYARHRETGFELIGVAMDAAYPDKARSYVESAKPAFANAIDSVEGLWDLLGFDLLPSGFYVDENGIIRYLKIGGFDIRDNTTMRIMQDLLAEKWSKKAPKFIPKPKLPLKRTITQLAAQVKSTSRGSEKRLRLADLLFESGQFRKAAREYDTVLLSQPNRCKALFARGVVSLRNGDTATTLEYWRKALVLNPNSWIIRKQIWALTHPGQFYPSINYEWQQEQMRREEWEVVVQQKAKAQKR